MSTDRSVLQLARKVLKVFSTTPEGRDVLKEMRQRFGKQASYVKGDTHDTTYREGRRAVILWIERQFELAKAEVKDEEGED